MVMVRPIEVAARMMDPVEVSFGMKRYTVEDGNFQRWTRNGAQCPVNLVGRLGGGSMREFGMCRLIGF